MCVCVCVCVRERGVLLRLYSQTSAERCEASETDHCEHWLPDWHAQTLVWSHVDVAPAVPHAPPLPLHVMQCSRGWLSGVVVAPGAPSSC